MNKSILERDSVDLTNCDREPIHVPGAILPHGAMRGSCDPRCETLRLGPSGGRKHETQTMEIRRGERRADRVMIIKLSAKFASLLGRESANAQGSEQPPMRKVIRLGGHAIQCMHN